MTERVNQMCGVCVPRERTCAPLIGNTAQTTAPLHGINHKVYLRNKDLRRTNARTFAAPLLKQGAHI